MITIKRQFIIFSLLLLCQLPLIVLGFLVIPVRGEVVGLCVSLLITFLFFILGDRFLLALLQAKNPGEQSFLEDTVNNLACRLGMGKVDIYISYKQNRNIFFIEAPLKYKSSIVIGHDLLNKLSKEEVELLIFSSLLKIKMGEARYRTAIALIMLFAYWPFFLLQRPFVQRRKALDASLGFLVNFYFLPLILIRNYLLGDKKDEHLKEQMLRLSGKYKEYEAAIFKLTQLEDSNTDLSLVLVEGLSVTSNKINSLSHQIIMQKLT